MSFQVMKKKYHWVSPTRVYFPPHPISSLAFSGFASLHFRDASLAFSGFASLHFLLVSLTFSGCASYRFLLASLDSSGVCPIPLPVCLQDATFASGNRLPLRT